MSLRQKILLLMLLITVGTAAALASIVTLNLTRHETRRADDRIAFAIESYLRQVDSRQQQVQKIVRALLEAPAPRSQLQAADEEKDPTACEQLRQEVFGRTVQTELRNPDADPAFHVLVNMAGEVLLTVAPEDASIETNLEAAKPRWPVDEVLAAKERLVRRYVRTASGLYLTMGVPLHTQLDDQPTLAYFVGFKVDDAFVRRQLLSEQRSAGTTDAPLSAWFICAGKVVAKASAAPDDHRPDGFVPASEMKTLGHFALPTSRAMNVYEEVEFTLRDERYLGQWFELETLGQTDGGPMPRLVLASSMDQALRPLKDLQWQILLCTVVACLAAVIACRIVADRIVRPIKQLVEGTRRIKAGHFERPITVRRRDELGALADAFNEMATGLQERDVLRDEHTRIQRDLALARKIQMDVLPKHIPSVAGYDVAAYSLPAEQTGGDIYDLVAVKLGGGAVGSEPDAPSSLVLLLADATGHGVGSALSVTQVRSMMRIGVRLNATLQHVFAQINYQLCQDLGAGRFVTAFLGMLDPLAHGVTYHSAGQAPLLLIRALDNSLIWLDSSMLPLGIDEDPQDDGVQHLTLEEGDVLVLLTDGFYEFRGPDGDEFGKERVAEILLAHRSKPSKEMLAELLMATQRFADGTPQFDDMTAVIMKRLDRDVTVATQCGTSGSAMTPL